ncbi:TrkH family potassium uptake protein [Sporolactobacillus sp. STSJ-5]|uniref:TrkH family potassium uptake protein n=1 Tax=Sporolactobacillus sp. STSJ-5 TaxID=2965076 RepID=UPI0021080961|nr:TrkH family potassium uptake protein [Sporolactobacillus sp. STSJ-5]MCQ2010387.1 TrkH family potassium uptake protein [Sporolactobacillus sp. STSJ-5]
MTWFRSKMAQLDIRPITFNPPLLLVLIFLAFVIVGCFMLKLPIATTHSISWIDAFFISTSAATVTGLAPIDPSTTFTMFGKTVIMLLIQIGGLGIMSFAVFFVILLGGKVSIRQRQLMQEALNQPSFGGVIRLVVWLLVFSVTIECVAALLISTRLVPEFGWSRGLFYSVFHAVSAFNNAGFALFPDNLIRYVGDPVINLTISGLIVTGGLGFTVLAELLSERKFRKMSLHSRMMITGTIVLNVIAIAGILLIEWHNARTLGKLPLGEKLWAGYFQGITPRTAGFNTIDYSAMATPGILLTVFLMFVGAGSTSTGGGIKLTTFIVLAAEMISFIKGRPEVEVGKRTIGRHIVARALTIALTSLILVFVSVFTLSITEQASLERILFEVVSAFGTVGLSMGLTAHLTVCGKLVIMCVMFLGKIGPLTIAFSFLKRMKANIRYPDEDIFIG